MDVKAIVSIAIIGHRPNKTRLYLSHCGKLKTSSDTTDNYWYDGMGELGPHSL